MLKNIKLKLISITAVSSLMLFSGCGDLANSDENIVGDNFVSAEVIEDVNISTMLSVVKAKIDENATNAFGYKAVKLKYKTTNQDGGEVIASGLLVIPTASEGYKQYLKSLGKSYSISMICDNHGTIFEDAEAPTNVEKTNGLPDYSLGVLMSGYAGFAGIYPDYIGYGASVGTAHPYILEKASAQVSLDMIKASIKYMTDNNVLFNGQLFVSGYSEGGYVAMALAKDIQENHSSEFTLKGVAPMAGPYDVKALGNIEIDANHTMVYPAFLVNLADAYSHFYSDISSKDIFVEQNSTFIHSLFDGSKSAPEIHTNLGLTTNYGFNTYKANVLFKDSFINDYKNNVNNTLKTKLQENNIDDWTPNSKMNLIQCVDDEIIPFAEANNTYNKFIANGAADVILSAIPTAALSQQQDATHPFVHANCATEAYGSAVKWFDTIRQGN